MQMIAEFVPMGNNGLDSFHEATQEEVVHFVPGLKHFATVNPFQHQTLNELD